MDRLTGSVDTPNSLHSNASVQIASRDINLFQC